MRKLHKDLGICILLTSLVVNSLFIFLVFFLIVIDGKAVITEPTIFILWIEFFLSFVILVGSILYTLNYIREITK